MTGAAVAIVFSAKCAESVLGAAADSLLQQTRRDWEAIIVNDGSADGTSDYAARDRRFRIFEGPGRGVAAAQNAGLRAASAAWLVFLDAESDSVQVLRDAGLVFERGVLAGDRTEVALCLIFVTVAAASGNKLYFSTRPGVARLGDSAMNLPRIEIRGDWETFAQNVEVTR
jgi:glycosyltransferase involved in cell wall biosynthesis